MVSPPRNATIIRLSELVSSLPEMEDDMFNELMKKGYKTKVLADITAVLVCGQIKPLNVFNPFSVIKHIIWRKRYKKVKRLAMYDSSPKMVEQALLKLLPYQELGVFFSLITSLKGVNTLKPTR